jgi:uncharacterized protein (DUF362 family)
VKRRDFIKKAGLAFGAASVAGAAGFVFHNRGGKRSPTIHHRECDFRVAADAALPAVALAQGVDPLRSLRLALDGVGGPGRFVKRGESVVIKPNVAWDRTAEEAANTNPVLVGEMVRLCLAAGAGSVMVTDVTCNDPRRTFVRSGIREAVEAAGGSVYFPTDQDYVDVAVGGEFITVWPVLRAVLDADCLINMPITKHHSLAECTVVMKNLYGIVGGRRNQLHQSIDQSIVDLARFCRPTLTVIDSTRVLLRGGPQGGDLEDVDTPGAVLCATDPVAGDARAVEYLGLRGDQVGHIALAAAAKLGSLDYRAAGFQEIR